MNYPKKLAQARKNRGQASASTLDAISSLSDSDLISKLKSKEAETRTAACIHLGKRKLTSAIEPLCRILETDTLYPRISASAALVEIGAPAIPSLILLLGKTGQSHTELPNTGFYKKSYALPRDLAARCLIRFGPIALQALQKVLHEGNRIPLLEAIDAIGHISFNFQDSSSEQFLIDTYQRYESDPLVKWKLIRAFQGFRSRSVIEILDSVICDGCNPTHVMEAIRIRILTKIKIEEVLRKNILQLEHLEVRKVASFYLSLNP